jgi:hypothetical protein
VGYTRHSIEWQEYAKLVMPVPERFVPEKAYVIERKGGACSSCTLRSAISLRRDSAVSAF